VTCNNKFVLSDFKLDTVHQVFKCDQYLWVVFQVISGFIRSLIYLFHELTEIGLVGKVL